MTDNNRKGSVIVMVVGLLVLLAMVGTTFIIVAHMDRREAASIATAAPMKQVAGGVLQQIRAKLVEDLYFDVATGAVIYGKATKYQEQIDFPHEDYDKPLASFGPVMVNGVSTWRHISNHNDVGVFADVSAADPLLVDTDGYFNDGLNAGDAKLFDSGVSNRSGQKYYVAYRLIDASSLMNVNSAYGPPAAAAAGTVMPITNISLEALLASSTIRDDVHEARNGSTSDNIATYNANYVRRPLNPAAAYLPFDASDMTALLWGGAVPNTASGRMFEALGGQFGAAKPYLTVFSASRNYVRQTVGIPNDLKLTHRVDMNITGATAFVDLFKAFYNAIPQDVPGFPSGNAGRRTVAAQLAVNVIDYRDGDDTPREPTLAEKTAVGLGGGTVFGIERQPFITEAWLRMEWDAGINNVKQWSAIELFNPYKTTISLTGYKLKVGANTNDLQNPPNIPAGGRVVIVSCATTEIRALSKSQDTNLDLRETCTLLRQTSVAGSYAPVGSVGGNPPSEFGLTVPIAAGPAVHARIRRDDTVARAKYSVAVYTSPQDYTYKIGDPGCPPDDASTNLGRSNSDVDLGAAVAPTPVFVRNGNLINLGEVSRIFYVGPQSDGTPLDNALASMAPNDKSNGRLYTFGALKIGGWASAYTPDIPPVCMLGDYMDVLVPDPLNTGRTDTVYGRININTAPWQVIRYLPGISAMAQRDLIATDIVAYRDLLNNTSTGGTNYSGGATARANAMVPVLTDLRGDAGFASPGEIAIPIYLRGSKADIAAGYRLPQNNYSAIDESPYNYTLEGTADDGLDEITGDLSKYDIYYSWLSNQLTVRSDVYIAYIRVQIGDSATTTGAVRKYVAVIDRSNCTSTNDLPNVVMFAEMK